MADVQWIGAAQSTPQVDTFTVGGTPTAGNTYTVTINGKTVSYVAVAGDTTATVAAALQALLAASTEGEFAEVKWAVPGGATTTITATGPSDGAPITTAAGGTGTFSRATTTNPVSPHDAANGANYSTGALPAAGSRLVLDGGGESILYGLAALTNAISFLRRPGYDGQVGLPDVNATGNYREYRQTHLNLNATSIVVQESSGDSAGQMRLACTAGSACTLTVTGQASGVSVGQEVLEVTGLPAASVVNCTSGSVTISPLDGQISAVATLTAADSTVSAGIGVTLGTATLRNCSAALDCGYTTLNANGGAVTMEGGGAGTTTNVYAGTLGWQSTGSFGTLTLGPGAVLDLSEAPAAVTPGGTITLSVGSVLRDPGGRIATGTAFAIQNTGLPTVSIDLGPNRTITLTT